MKKNKDSSAYENIFSFEKFAKGLKFDDINKNSYTDAKCILLNAYFQLIFQFTLTFLRRLLFTFKG